MKQYIIKLFKNILIHIISIILAIGVIIAFATISWPTNTPSWESSWGKFASVLNNILQSWNFLTDTSGKVKTATTADTADTVSTPGLFTSYKKSIYLSKNTVKFKEFS